MDLHFFHFVFVNGQYYSNVLLSLGVAFFLSRFLLSRKRSSLPPGPKGVPILGNLLQMNNEAWYSFTEWGKVYGPVLYLNLAGQPVIVLNTFKAACDIMDRRAKNYSDRPRFIVAGEYLTRGMLIAFTRYGDLWRKMRRACHEGLNSAVSKSYYNVQTNEAVLLTHGILKNAANWEHEVRRAGVSAITGLLYDLPPLTSASDPSIKVINDAAATITRAAYPGAHLVEVLRFLQYTPSFLAKWKRDANAWFEPSDKMFQQLFQDARERNNKSEEERPSFCVRLAATKEHHGLSNQMSAWLSAAVHIAGSETTTTALLWFFVSMVSHPEVQRKAQAEIDDVIGRSRLPSFSDRNDLPYVCAIVKEILRWRPPAPIGLPHSSVEDDWYEGYLIPKGSICISNIWGINRDPDVYGVDAAVFRPERFVDLENEQLVRDTKGEGHGAYGFGRRICPGLHVANNTLFIDIATILWAVHLEAPLDGNGQPILPDIHGEVKDGVVVHPTSFKCNVRPRFENVESMLQQAKEQPPPVAKEGL